MSDGCCKRYNTGCYRVYYTGYELEIKNPPKFSKVNIPRLWGVGAVSDCQNWAEASQNSEVHRLIRDMKN